MVIRPAGSPSISISKYTLEVIVGPRFYLSFVVLDSTFGLSTSSDTTVHMRISTIARSKLCFMAKNPYRSFAQLLRDILPFFAYPSCFVCVFE